MTPEQAMQLFRVSALKQQKWRRISSLLGDARGLRGLDIGADNGVISYLLREAGGSWKSADLEADAVEAIRALVGCEVYQIDGRTTPFGDAEFDRIVIVDFLEHIHTDREFVAELARILRSGGELIVNVPHVKQSWLRRFRLWIGQTDKAHGHVRPGYTVESLAALLGGSFAMTASGTYSKFFSEAVDTLITWGYRTAQGKRQATSRKGTVVTGQDLRRHQRAFQLYRLVYPFVWLMSRMDRLLVWRSGYMLIVKATRLPRAAVQLRTAELSSGAVSR